MSPQIIYFIKPVGMPGPIKIGCSDAPERRLLDLATWSPFLLEILVVIPGTMTLENNIHECFADLHSHREWFHPGDRLLAMIEKLRAGVPITEAIDLNERVGVVRHPWQRTPEFRQYMGLRTRLWNALRRCGTKEFCLHRPNDIERAFRVACKRGHVLTEVDIARINEVIADPIAHCERYYFRKQAAA